MAKYNPSYTPPVSTALTELYYSETENGKPTQIFGVQGIPRLSEPPEDVTYKTLESDEEFGAAGIKAFTAIEITLMLYPEQDEELKALDDKSLYWYVKYPKKYGIITKWKGQMKYIRESLELDDMCKSVMKIYKDTIPEDIESLPTGD